MVFYGIDRGTQTIRDNSGIVSGGLTGTVQPRAAQLTIPEQFARSMSLDDALDPRNLLCYEMNGEPLPQKNGFPVRLIAPGWYGVANVKWLTRIEVRDQRHAGNFMARDYVTIREEQRNGQPFWTFSTVRHIGSSRLQPKSYVEAAATSSLAPPGVRRSQQWKSASTMDRGCRRGSSGRWPTGGTGVAWRGGSGRSAGECLPRASTRDVAGIRHRRQRAAAPDDPFLASKGPSGRATDTSRARFSFPDRHQQQCTATCSNDGRRGKAVNRDHSLRRRGYYDSLPDTIRAISN